MREIKFRAWNKELNTWLCPDEVYSELHDQARFNPEKGKWIVLMQFTGLHDKNGKEIYEGDILSVNWGGAEKSEYYLQKLGNPFVMEFRNYGWFPFTHALPTPNDITIIGSIYENPELLNK